MSSVIVTLFYPPISLMEHVAPIGDPPVTTFDTLAYLQSLRHQVTEVRILRESPYLQLNGKGRGEFVGKTVFGYYDFGKRLAYPHLF